MQHNNHAIARFIYEAGHLRRIRHEGWRLAGVSDPDSVAEHSLRTAQIAYILAYLEGYPNPAEVCAMAVFHDIGETRVGDIHKVANRYIQVRERDAVCDQTRDLGRPGEEIVNWWTQIDNRSTTAGIIAKDADYLEQAATAKEYAAIGFDAVSDWLYNIASALRTESARRLFAVLLEADPFEWWKGLKKLDHEIHPETGG